MFLLTKWISQCSYFPSPYLKQKKIHISTYKAARSEKDRHVPWISNQNSDTGHTAKAETQNSITGCCEVYPVMRSVHKIQDTNSSRARYGCRYFEDTNESNSSNTEARAKSCQRFVYIWYNPQLTFNSHQMSQKHLVAHTKRLALTTDFICTNRTGCLIIYDMLNTEKTRYVM